MEELNLVIMANLVSPVEMTLVALHEKFLGQHYMITRINMTCLCKGAALADS